MTIIKTVIIVSTTGERFSLPGAFTAAQVRANYSDSLTAIATMGDSTDETTTAEGGVRTITFAPKTGNKG